MRFALVVLLAAGCKGEGTPQGCEEYATDLGKRLEAASQEPPSPIYFEDGFEPVERSDLAQANVGYAPVVYVTPTTAQYQGQALAAPALRERLAEARAKVAEDIERGLYRRDVPDPAHLYIAIDRRAPWPLVVETFEAATAAGMSKRGIVFSTKPNIQLPPRAPIDDQLDAVLREEPNNRASELARLVKEQVSGCPSVGRVFGAVASEEDNKALSIARALPGALIDCRCRVPKENLRSVMLRVLYIEKPARVVELQPDAPAETIALPATATWADAATLVKPATRNLTLVVAAK